MKEITIRKLFKNTTDYINKTISIEGWVKSLRDSKTFGFIELMMEHFLKIFKLYLIMNYLILMTFAN